MLTSIRDVIRHFYTLYLFHINIIISKTQYNILIWLYVIFLLLLFVSGVHAQTTEAWWCQHWVPVGLVHNRSRIIFCLDIIEKEILNRLLMFFTFILQLGSLKDMHSLVHWNDTSCSQNQWMHANQDKISHRPIVKVALSHNRNILELRPKSTKCLSENDSESDDWFKSYGPMK